MNQIELIAKQCVPGCRVEGGENKVFIYHGERFLCVPYSIKPEDLQNRLITWTIQLEQEYY